MTRPSLLGAPLLLLWIIPLSMVSYLLLILPGMAVAGRDLPQPWAAQRERGRRYLVAVLIPVGCWFIVALVARLFVKV
jgi:hypothetical protein